jgi:outer membrane protein assembly factor BamB
MATVSTGRVLEAFMTPMIVVSGDGGRIAICSKRLQLLVFDRKGQPVWQAKEDRGFHAAAISRNGLLTAAISMQSISLFDAFGNRLWNHPTASKASEGDLQVVMSSDGALLVAEPLDRSLLAFDRAGTLLWSKPPNLSGYPSIGLDPTGSYVVVGARDGWVYAFDRSGDEMWRFLADSAVRDVSVAPRGFIAGISLQSGKFLLIDNTGKIVTKTDTEGLVTGIHFSSDAAEVGIVTREGALQFMAIDGTPLHRFRLEGILPKISASEELDLVAVGSTLNGSSRGLFRKKDRGIVRAFV